MSDKVNSSPQVSVVIPAYNTERFIGAAIASVRAQTGISIEILVIDDGSTDTTARIALEAGARVIQQSQAGAAAARNRGIAESRGAYVAFLDADDLWCQAKLERQIAVLETRPDIDLVFGHLLEVSTDDSDTQMLRGIEGRTLRGYSPITMLCRVETFKKVGLFQESLSRGEFIDWCARASELGIGIELLDTIMAKRRIHRGNTGKLAQPGSSDYAKVAYAALARRRQLTNASAPHAPVVIFLYNRAPEITALITALRAAKVPRIFAICDGPRADHAADAAAVEEARSALRLIDWQCEVNTLNAETNQGIRRSYENGLAWVFDAVDQAIILEDDCIPEPSFFRYCNELLVKFADDRRVRVISGMSVGDSAALNNESYTFSKYPLTWGWATWKRAWADYDATMNSWNGEETRNWLTTILDDQRAVDYWCYLFWKNAQTREHWDTNWIHSCWRSSGLSIHPAQNLISNIGFGPSGTHARNPRSVFSRMPASTLQFPLIAPPTYTTNHRWDLTVEQSLFSGPLHHLFHAVREKLRAVGEST